MNEEIRERRRSTDRWSLGGGLVVVGMIACMAGGMWIGTHPETFALQPTPDRAPNLASASVLDAAPTPTPITLLPGSTESVYTSSEPLGRSCYYSAEWINQIATPIPNGERSAYQGYLCQNGYWDVGKGDWVNQNGEWGKPDGKLEEMYVEFDSLGHEVARMAVGEDGIRYPDPPASGR